MASNGENEIPTVTVTVTDTKTQKETTNPTPTNPTVVSPETTSSDPKTVTLASENCKLDYPSFSQLLEGVMAANSAVSSLPNLKDVAFQGQFGMSHQEALASVTAKAAQANTQMPLQPDSSKPSPPTTQSESSLPTSTALVNEQTPSRQQNDHNQNAKHESTADDLAKTPKPDGYSWRKYGQKQVKSSGSSRSYYRCTYLSCCAKKKVQHLDISGQIIGVDYEGYHNHDPPQNSKGSSRKRDPPSTCIETSLQKLNDSNTSTCKRELEQAIVPLTDECLDSNLNASDSSQREAAEGELHSTAPDTTPRVKSEAAAHPVEAERGGPVNSNELQMTDPMKERDLAPLKKRRIKEFGKVCPAVYRTFKEPKIVVHPGGDVGTSSDGYRWRKYGQKMVKGNPHPRSYYKCSSPGCPTRKHVERATDNSTAIVVTYEGKHNHDMPVPKKHHVSPADNGTALPSQMSEIAKSPSPSQGEKASEGGTEKVLESARTLLSIGVELKSC